MGGVSLILVDVGETLLDVTAMPRLEAALSGGFARELEALVEKV